MFIVYCSGSPTSHHYSVLGVLVCVVCGDPPTVPGGSDSCHLFTEGHTPSSLLYCSHHLEGGGGGTGSMVLRMGCTNDCILIVLYTWVSNYRVY